MNMIYAADIILPITSAPIEDGAVLVQEGRIAAIGRRPAIIAEYHGEDVEYFQNSIFMPGLVNLHGHFECATFDFLAEPTPFPQWLGRIIQASSRMERDDWLQAARLGVRKSLEAGITCAADITRSGAGLQAAAEAGVPALIYFEVVGVDDGNLTEAVIGLLERIKGGESIAEARGLKLGVSPHSPYTLSSSALKVCSEISREYRLPLSIHLAETQAEVELVRNGSGPLASAIGGRLKLEVIEEGGAGKTPAAYLDGFGLINEALVAAHGVWLGDEDIALLKERGAAIAVCPTSNEMLGSGEAPVAKFVDHGVAFGIGTDSIASNPGLDMFTEVRKVQALLAKQQGSSPAVGITSKKLVEMLTIEAARILGFAGSLGSIEPGKRADFIVIDSNKDSDNRVSGNPLENPYDYIIDSVSRSSISRTILDGKIVYDRRSYT